MLDDPSLLKQACYIAGSWLGEAGQTVAVCNPATQQVLGRVSACGEALIDEALNAAETAFKSWSASSAKDRSILLQAFARRMLEHKEDLARIITLEQGKPLRESRGEVDYAASYFSWFSQEALRVRGELLEPPKPSQSITLLKKPLGVSACITPWNFPLAMLARKVAAALAAGCTVVAKPSELTPFSGLVLGALAERVGLPKGVLNVLVGDPSEIGQAFCRSPIVKKISFTGSTRVGRILIEGSAQNIQKLSLELGGNAPFIVFEDAQLDSAIEGLMAAKFRNAGQTCISVNRLFVHESVYSNFVESLAQRMLALKCGNGLEDDTEIGPLVNDAALEKFNRHVSDALAKGAGLLCGGLSERRDLFVRPTLLVDARSDMLFNQEETFGPLLAAIPFKGDDEVLSLANSTPYGLAAYIYTANHSRIKRFQNQLEAGMLGINETSISNAAAPFGGIKCSGFGREGSHYGIEEFLYLKYVLESELR